LRSTARQSIIHLRRETPTSAIFSATLIHSDQAELLVDKSHRWPGQRVVDALAA
jgi:hypothetical protein